MSADHVGRGRDVLTRAHELAQSLATWAMIRSTSSNVSMFATKKNAADFVTDIDLGIELWVRRTIAEEFPTHAFVGEEFEDSAGVEYTWYCDPIDGTTNYAHGISWFSFSLAMCDEDGPVVGVVADPRTKEVFSAIRGAEPCTAVAPSQSNTGPLCPALSFSPSFSGRHSSRARRNLSALWARSM